MSNFDFKKSFDLPFDWCDYMYYLNSAKLSG